MFMPSGLFKDARVRFGLAGLALGASAPLLDALLQYLIFHSHSSFLEYLRYLSHQPEVLATHAFYVAGVAVMGAAGVLVGALRQSDAEHKAMLEAKNAELHKSREELKKLSEGLEEKVKDGQEEIIEVARRLKEANAKLLRQVEIQRKIAGNVPSLLALMDPEMRFVEMNEYGSRRFVDRPLSEILGKRCYEVMGDGKGVCIQECAAQKALATGREASHLRSRVVRGNEVVTENKSIPIKDEHGNVAHVLMIVTDTTARKKEEDELKRRANRDALTGVYNKHYLDLYMQNEERKNKMDKRKRGPYTIMYADLDGLKEANDSYGHEGGDVLLRKLSQVFQDNTRHEDIVARVGGDEFVIILPHSGPEEGEVLISRFKRQCEEWNRTKDLSPGKAGLTLKASYGLATSIYGIDLAETINRADTTMYRAKKDRRAVNGPAGHLPPPQEGHS